MLPAPSYRNILYVSGPYTATDQNPSVEHNIQDAWRVAFKYWRLGYAVICPQANSYHMDAASYQDFIEGTMEMMERCDGVVMMKGWEKSNGARGEHARALELKLPIHYE